MLPAFFRMVSRSALEKLTPNYAFKPTAEQAFCIGRGASRRGGLTQRWASFRAFAGVGRDEFEWHASQ